MHVDITIHMREIFTFEVLHLSAANKCFLLNLIKIVLRLFYVKKVSDCMYFSLAEPSNLLNIFPIGRC